jgi:hypothetical protein
MRQVSNRSRARILNEFQTGEFQTILAKQQTVESKDAPQEQAIQTQEVAAILETTSPCNSDRVGGLADLQLEFDHRMAGLRIRLTSAHEKIEELKCAIGFAKLRWIAEQDIQCNPLKTRVNALKRMDDQTHTYEIRLQALLETLHHQESQVYLMSKQLALALQQVQDLTVKATSRTSVGSIDHSANELA